jgi:hypothetical protein
VDILARYFLVTSQAGVNSMHISLDGGQERPGDGPGRLVVECNSAVWTYRYVSGYMVALQGRLTVYFALQPDQPAPATPTPLGSLPWKIEHLEFESRSFEKYISVAAVLAAPGFDPSITPRMRNSSTPVMTSVSTSEDHETIERAMIPKDPVNHFGIPQATMRCLEVS